MIANNLNKRIYTSIILFILIFLTLLFKPVLALSLLIIGVFSLLEFFNIIKRSLKNKFFSFFSNLIFFIYVFSFCTIFFVLSYYQNFEFIIFCLLFGCIASDLGGFIFGKIFKGPKLTKISPNKTISGSVGSIVLTIFVFSYSIFFFSKNFDYIIVITAIITSIACQSGDLFFSLLKRKAKIKDSGNFLPGHGGFLDRFDGIFLGIPIGFLSLMFFY
jgi:phosphatidate cytidylyltransferase